MKFFCSLKETHSRCSFRGQLFLALSASCLALAVTCFIAWTRAEEEQVAAALAPEVLRFHVLADSNSPDDQALKLQVRDLLLKEIRQGNLWLFWKSTNSVLHNGQRDKAGTNCQ